ncbi:hypothetical protein Syun_008617 [Stephania yunnanensis]|uniref:Uncharacterized protein n=1 Tax=Stephania yunnanensis TaxID=152371 RepID=A0AAP0PMR2_9MAGN
MVVWCGMNQGGRCMNGEAGRQGVAGQTYARQDKHHMKNYEWKRLWAENKKFTVSFLAEGGASIQEESRRRFSISLDSRELAWARRIMENHISKVLRLWRVGHHGWSTVLVPNNDNKGWNALLIALQNDDESTKGSASGAMVTCTRTHECREHVEAHAIPVPETSTNNPVLVHQEVARTQGIQVLASIPLEIGWLPGSLNLSLVKEINDGALIKEWHLIVVSSVHPPSLGGV